MCSFCFPPHLSFRGVPIFIGTTWETRGGRWRYFLRQFNRPLPHPSGLPRPDCIGARKDNLNQFRPYFCAESIIALRFAGLMQSIELPEPSMKPPFFPHTLIIFLQYSSTSCGEPTSSSEAGTPPC